MELSSRFSVPTISITNNKQGDANYYNLDYGIVEIFVTLRLPVNAYELAAGLYRIADFRSFDDYVSDCVIIDLDMMTDGAVSEHVINSKIKGDNSQWMKEQKQHWGDVVERLNRRGKTMNLTHNFYTF